MSGTKNLTSLLFLPFLRKKIKKKLSFKKDIFHKYEFLMHVFYIKIGIKATL